MVAAWESAHPDAPMAEQYVVLTVPASFDASAARADARGGAGAGLPSDLVLLEEPQAAVYAWLAAIGDRWRRVLSVGDTLLVCDVGGGTTDLTLVGAAEEQGELVLRRIAVGNHLLVGGDNMDLTLAHYVAGRFAEKGVQLDPWQSVGLVALVPRGQGNAARAALRQGRQFTHQRPQHLGARPRPKTDRRHGFRRSRSPRRERIIGRRFLSPLPADRPARAESGSPVSAKSACRSSPTRPSPVTWRHSSGPRRRTGQSGAADPRAL